MPAFTEALARHLHDHLGLVHDAELDALGVTPGRRRRLVADRILVPVLDQVYRAASSPFTFEARCLAICMASPDGVVTGRAAGKLWGVRGMGRLDRIEVRLPHFRKALDEPWILVRRCNVLDAVDVTQRTDGIRVVSPPRLAFDLAACVDDDTLESVIEQILDERWCTLPTIFDVGRRLVRPARPGSARFARVVGSRPTWLKPVDSDHELRLHRALERAGITGLARQVPIVLPSRRTIHADLAVPSLQWAIPIDHVTWHGGRVDAQRDKQNDREAHAVGWQVDRVTDDDIDRHLRRTVHELVAAWRRRAEQFHRASA